MVKFSSEKFRKVKEEKNLTCEELSKRSNGIVTLSYVSRLQNGNRQPTIDKLSGLAKGLSVSFLDLLDFDKSEIDNYKNQN